MNEGRTYIKGYDARGNLLLHTSHDSPGSEFMEIEAWRARMDRGEAAYIEVVRPGKDTEVIRAERPRPPLSKRSTK